MTTHVGKVALVTGAGRGIGQAIADAHAAAGAKVAYLDNDPELAKEAAQPRAPAVTPLSPVPPTSLISPLFRPPVRRQRTRWGRSTSRQ